MSEVPLHDLDGERASSNIDHHLEPGVAETKDGISHNLDTERDLQESANRSEKNEQANSNKCTKKSKHGRPKTSSRRGKLSLRKNTSDSTKQTGSVGSQGKIPKEVLKAILGETSLNQSSDFKEPWSHGSGLGLRGKKKTVGSLTRQKTTKSQTTVQDPGPSGSNTPNLNICSHNDGQLEAIQTEMPSTSCTRESQRTTSTPPRESSLKDCSVYISKLNLHNVKSTSPRKLNREPLGDVAQSVQISTESLQPATNCSKVEPQQSRTKPSLLPLDDDNIFRKCPICDKTFPGDAACVPQSHVQICLRQKFTKSVKAIDDTCCTGNTSGDEDLARALQRREEEKAQEEMLTETEKFFCHICQRDLSHMNSTRRTQHINRCLDNVEALEPKHQSAPTKSPMIPDCPICGKHFKTQLQRKSHLKKCARQNQISAQQLILLVREQEEQTTAQPHSQGAVGNAVGGTGVSSIGGALGHTKEEGSGRATGGVIAGAIAGAGIGSIERALGHVKRGAIGSTSGAARDGTVTGITKDAIAPVGTAGVLAGDTRDPPVHTVPSTIPGTSTTKPYITANARPTVTGIPGARTTETVGADGRMTDPAGVNRTSDETVGVNQILPRLQSRGRGGGVTSRGRGSLKGKRKQKQPTPAQMEHVDEDIQVALALSASLIQDNTTGQSAKRAANDDLPMPLGKPALAGRRRRKGKKEIVKEVPLLLRRTEEEHKKVLGQRMADIVFPMDDTEIQKTPCITRSKVADRYEPVSPRQPRSCVRLAEAVAMASCRGNTGSDHKASTIDSPSNETNVKSDSGLWNLASAADESNMIPYYVNQLLPAVTPHKPKSLRNPSHPGANRDLTPRQVGFEASSQQNPLPSEPSQPATSPCLSQDSSATQALGRTVQILAELADEGTSHPYTQSSDRSHLAASGFIAAGENRDEQMDQETSRGINSIQQDILQSLSSLVNSKHLSDLHIVTSDETLIFAHQFMISLRCPSLAQLIEDAPSQSSDSAKRLSLLDFNGSTVICALDFIYAGKMTATSCRAREVAQFAERFSLTELSEFCRKMIIKENSFSGPEPDTPMQDAQPDICNKSQQLGQNSDEFLPDKGLDELMQSLWESSSSSGEETDDSLKSEDDCLSDKDGGKMLSSQSKRKVSHRVTDTESDAEGKDSVPDEEDLEEIYEYISTQRQKKGLGNRLKEDNVGDTDIDEDASDKEKQGNSSQNVSENNRRHAFTIIEQLQSSCQPQNPRSSTDQFDKSGLDVGRQLSRSIVLEKNYETKTHTSTSSDDVVNSSLERVTTPCFISIKKLSDDISVSPMKDKLSRPTVGSCLQSQRNLKPRNAEKWKWGEDETQKPGRAGINKKRLDKRCQSTKEPDATLADVGDSIFNSSDESDSDVENMDISQDWEFEGMNHKSHETSPNFKVSVLLKSDGEFEEEANCTVSLFDSSADVSRFGGIVSSERESASGSSGTEGETLPFVNINSQPDKREIRDTGTNDAYKVARSDEERRLNSRREGTVVEFKDACVDVIDLSYDDEETGHAATLEGGRGDIKGVIHGPESANLKTNLDGDLLQETKTSSGQIVIPHSKKSSPKRPPMAKPQKFTFRRRDIKPIIKKLADTKPLNKVDVSVVPSAMSAKPKQSEMFTSVSETPVAFRVADNVMRDTSTPMYGQNSAWVSRHQGFILSLDKALVGDASPALKGNEQKPKITPKTNIVESASSEQLNDNQSLSLPSTLLRPTPDCFDADTPEIISSIPPPPLSPSPPPSPTFGPSRLTQKDASSLSLSAVSCDDTIVNEGSITRRKRKLQTEDFSSSDEKIATKRPKSTASQMPCSVIDANHLSPAGIIDEYSVFQSAEDDENEALSSRANFKTSLKSTDTSDISWPDHLCVGRSPTRHSSESSSVDLEVDNKKVPVIKSPKSSCVSTQVQESSPRPRITTSYRSCSPLSPVTITDNLNSLASPKKASEFAADLQTPNRIRCASASQEEIKSQDNNSSQKSSSDAANNPSPRDMSPLPQDVSEDQFGYYGADDGGFMDDFNFYCHPEVEDLPSEKTSPQRTSSQTKKDINTSGKGVSTTPSVKPSTSKPATPKSPPQTSRISHGSSSHGNITIGSFCSSEDAPSPPRPTLAVSTSQERFTNVLSKSTLLRDEAEEFGCSESFLCQLKEGNIDEETAWGGVRFGGGPSLKQSKDKQSRGRRQVVETPVVTRRPPMSQGAIDELYHPPAPITPMLPYDDMNTPHLKNELKRYGVKPLPKKKARLKLKEIYHHTHQVLEDSGSDTDKSGPSFRLLGAAPSANQPTSYKPISSKPTSSKPTSSKPTSSKPTSSKQPSQKAHFKKTAPLTGGGWNLGTKGNDGDLNSQKNTQTESGDKDDSSDQSEYGNAEDCPEGDYEEGEDEIMPSQTTAANLEEAIKGYIQSKSALYEKILQYEPLELDKFHTELKTAGIKYSKNNLRDFLDKHGITFRVITNKTKRHVKKPRKPKAK